MDCVGFRVHKRQCRQVIRGHSLTIFNECHQRRQQFVRERVINCISALRSGQAGMSMSGGAGGGGGSSGGNHSVVRGIPMVAERSFTTRVPTVGGGGFNRSKTAATIGASLGALSQSALARRHMLSSRSETFRYETELSSYAQLSGSPKAGSGSSYAGSDWSTGAFPYNP